MVESVTIEVPLAETPAKGYVSRHVEVNHMTERQSVALKILTAGLRREDRRLASGRSVNTSADAVRWLLERVGGLDI